MRARVLFGLVFFIYLWGPVRAPGPEAKAPLAAAAAAPFAGVIQVAYPLAASADQERWAGRLAGSFYAAAAVALTFAAVRCWADPTTALVLALLTAFATPLWSWAARGANLEAPAAGAMALALWLSVRRRPAGALALPLIAATGVALAIATAWGLDGIGARSALVFLAHLVSPGRGLLLFVATALPAFAAAVAPGPRRRFAVGGAILVLTVLGVLSLRTDPWGPPGFGPVLLTPLVPLLALMAAGATPSARLVGLLLGIPIAAAHALATFSGGHTWDERRLPVAHPEAVFDLRDNPFRDLISGPPRPDLVGLSPPDFVLPQGDHLATVGRPTPWLVYGWEPAEATGTWASGSESWIALAVPPGEHTLILGATAPLWGQRPQQVTIERPGYPPMEFTFSQGLWELTPLAIPFRSERALSLIVLRPAHVVLPGHGDVRRLTLFVTGLAIKSEAAERRPPPPEGS